MWIKWLIGLALSLVVGGWVTGFFVGWIRNCWVSELSSDTATGIPAWLVGVIERLFFTIVVAFDISSSAIAMVAWISVKMLTGWNRQGAKSTADGALSGLLGDVVSMLFALVGGLICAGKLPK